LLGPVELDVNEAGAIAPAAIRNPSHTCEGADAAAWLELPLLVVQEPDGGDPAPICVAHTVNVIRTEPITPFWLAVGPAVKMTQPFIASALANNAAAIAPLRSVMTAA
jgi:hypothetical protein